MSNYEKTKSDIQYFENIVKDIKKKIKLNLDNVIFVVKLTTQNRVVLSIKIIDNFINSRIYLKNLIDFLYTHYKLYYSKIIKKKSDFYISFQYI